ncbi:hypothetical protein BCR35DRAFT_326447 [Leucosporidium creatinivorum]|uniref:Uncharacterized protein n=1 Tax=Leucosporidium creatinivorum TaxID=106004 RepID=A0A1Y2EC68_9BASI|nr:hypothetical protein BCR35DRAFT_326447 [Leucosporidium creatinivorum]
MRAVPSLLLGRDGGSESAKKQPSLRRGHGWQARSYWAYKTSRCCSLLLSLLPLTRSAASAPSPFAHARQPPPHLSSTPSTIAELASFTMHFSLPLFVACLVTLLNSPTPTSAAPILASALPIARLPNRQLPLARPSAPPALRFADEETADEIVEPIKEVAVEESIFADFTLAETSTSSGQETKNAYPATTTFRITPKESDTSKKVKAKRSSTPKGKGKRGKHGKQTRKAKRELLERIIVLSSTTSGSATIRTLIAASSSSANASAPTPTSTLDTPTSLAPVATPSPVEMGTQHSAEVTESPRASYKWVPYAAIAQETLVAFA